MIFLKKSLMTITILVVAIWVMPAISDGNITELCKHILENYCKFKNDATDWKGTFKSKIESLESRYLSAGYEVLSNTFEEYYFTFNKTSNFLTSEMKTYLNKTSNYLTSETRRYLRKLSSPDGKLNLMTQKKLLKELANEIKEWENLLPEINELENETSSSSKKKSSKSFFNSSSSSKKEQLNTKKEQLNTKIEKLLKDKSEDALSTNLKKQIEDKIEDVKKQIEDKIEDVMKQIYDMKVADLPTNLKELIEDMNVAVKKQIEDKIEDVNKLIEHMNVAVKEQAEDMNVADMKEIVMKQIDDLNVAEMTLYFILLKNKNTTDYMPLVLKNFALRYMKYLQNISPKTNEVKPIQMFCEKENNAKYQIIEFWKNFFFNLDLQNEKNLKNLNDLINN